MYVDSHAHLTSDELFGQMKEILERAGAVGVERIVNICTDAETFEKGLKAAEAYPLICNAAAVTPHDVETIGERDFPLFERAAKEGQLVAVGETGLDYHYAHSPKELQIEHLERYLSLAKECELPVIIHCREAFSDFFSIIDRCYHGYKGVLHCFTGTLDEARGVIERGFYLSLSGIVTFKKSEALREVASYVPLERLLVETDAPYLAPQSKRGKTNEPAFIVDTVRVIAEAKKISLEEVAHCTAFNAKECFKL